MIDEAQAEAIAPEGTSRRQLLRMGMCGTIGALFATTLGGSMVMLWPRKQAGFGSNVTVPKKADEIGLGEVVTVREGKCHVTRTEDGFLALYWKCVHLGCTVPWVESQQQFVCPCHGAVYTQTGVNVAGPAPRPLDYMPVKIGADLTITVDTGSIRQRTVYEPGQAARA